MVAGAKCMHERRSGRELDQNTDREAHMQLRKQTVLDFIKDRGDEGRLGEAEEILPEEIETDRDGALLARLGVAADDLDDERGPNW
jgi:hypothetical protein